MFARFSFPFVIFVLESIFYIVNIVYWLVVLFPRGLVPLH